MADYDWFTTPLRDGWEITLKIRIPKRLGFTYITPEVVKYVIQKELRHIDDELGEKIVGIEVSEFKKADV